MNLTAGRNTTHFVSCPLNNVDTIDVLSLPRDKDYNKFIIAFICINAFVAIISSCSNFCVIYTISKTPSLQTPSNILILGLAVSDLVVGVVVEPSYCILRFAEFRRDISLFCLAGMVYNLSVWTIAASSLLTLTAITADRYLAVHLHLRYHEMVTSRRCGIVLALVWSISPTFCLCRLFAIPPVSKVLISFATIAFFCVLLLNAFFIFKISRVIHRHSVQIQAQQQSVQQSLDMPRYKKSVNTMYFVIAAFVLCYVPFSVTLVVLSVFESSIEFVYFTVISVTLVMFNGVLNPIIYCWRIREIRNAVSRLLKLLGKRNISQVHHS